MRGGDFLARIERSIEIEAPPSKIWPLLFWDRLPEWFEGIKAAQYTSEDKDCVGATAHVVGETAGVRVEFEVEITEYVENETATWRTTAGNFTAIGLTRLDPTDSHIKLTMTIDYELPYSILGKVIDKLLVSREFEKGFKRDLEKLKGMLEK